MALVWRNVRAQKTRARAALVKQISSKKVFSSLTMKLTHLIYHADIRDVLKDLHMLSASLLSMEPEPGVGTG